DPAARARGLADGDALARAPARVAVLPRRRADPRVLSDGGHAGGREADEPPRQQPPLLARDGVPRAESGAPPAGVHGGALQPAPATVLDPVLERGAVALLGDVPLGSRLPAVAGGSIGRTVLAHAPQRADHLLPELPSREDDPRAGHRLSRRYRGFRACERGSAGAALVQRQLLAVVPGQLHDRRAPAPRPASGAGRHEEDDRTRVPRRGVAGRSDADRDGARPTRAGAAHAPGRGAMAIRRAASAPGPGAG